MLLTELDIVVNDNITYVGTAFVTAKIAAAIKSPKLFMRV